MKACLSLILLLFTFFAHAQPAAIRMLQFNIWQEGTVVPGGFDAIVNEIIATKADVVTFSEVRNYKDSRFNERITAALKNKGSVYYANFSYDSGILSRYPITEFTAVFPPQNDQGSSYKAIINMNGTFLAVYTAHLDYLHAANYLSRGYDDNTWKKLDKKASDVSAILDANLASKRDEAIALIIADAIKEHAKNRLVFLGMDLNEPSHRDWAADTKDLFDHNGLIVPWQNTLTLEHAGFTDAYRNFYPDAVSHPGFTFPAFNKDVPLSKLVWAPDADDRDRIDFIFYMPRKGLHLQDIVLVGPKSSIVNGKPAEEFTADRFILPEGIWPTDHKAVLATFVMN